jgi:hypothetical protein
MNKIQLYFYSLFYGMKTTEDTAFHSIGITSSEGSSVIKEVEDQKLSKALLKGEVTTEVQELRYRTYKIEGESKNYVYYAPTLALKKENQDKKDIKYDDSDGLELITVQSNDALVESVMETLEQVGGRGKRTEYRIKIKRNFVPRYKVEQYITRLDVKKLDDDHAILDMYVSKYANDKDFKSKGFITEVEKIKNEHMVSDILDYEELSFITHHAYKMNDFVKFAFKNIRFREVVEFDGHYILRFKASFLLDKVDLAEKYYSSTMAEKYKNKEKKEQAYDMSNYNVVKVYRCEECGKEVFLDNEMIDELPTSQGRLADEDIKSDNPNVLEFMDMQMSEQTFGKRLCSECLKKYLKENNLL